MGPRLQTNIQKLVPLFGSSHEIARLAKVDKSAVVRWRQRRRPLKPLYQARLMEAARVRGLPMNIVAEALGVPRCPVCGTYHVLPY